MRRAANSRKRSEPEGGDLGMGRTTPEPQVRSVVRAYVTFMNQRLAMLAELRPATHCCSLLMRDLLLTINL